MTTEQEQMQDEGAEQGRLEIWPIERLIPYEFNAKKHGPEQIASIAKSISDYGWNTRIAVDKDGVIIAGHGRRLAAMKLGRKFIPVRIRDDLTPEQVRALRLVDNKTAESEIDTVILESELRALAEMASDFNAADYFSEKELSFFLEDVGEIDFGAVSEDISREVEEHTRQTEDRIQSTDDEMVPITKALGVARISGALSRRLSQAVAMAEASTGKQGIEALIDYAFAVDKVAQP